MSGLPLHRALVVTPPSETRIRVRLPAGIMTIFKQWAGELAFTGARGGLRRQALIETALWDTVRRLRQGAELPLRAHALCSYSLLLDNRLLEALNHAAIAHGIKCGALINYGLTDYLRRGAPQRYLLLRPGPAGRQIHGVRRMT